ncbi:MAG: haloalkane dehalogenase [Chloroflexia bacterium]
MISAASPYAKRYLSILGQTMAYVDEGSGDPLVFLHGNPTSSYLWRNVLPHLTSLGRCVAPDLIGMGDSAKLPHSGPAAYTFVEHRRYLDALLEALGIQERVTLILHDWGSALGFDWANRHRDAVRGIVYLEAIVQPRTWSDWRPPADQLFRALRSPAGEALILEQNVFVEEALPRGIQRPLTAAEMAEYRRPFATPGEGRRPTLTWPRQIPIDGEPAEVAAIVEAYAGWLVQSPVPKLFVNGEPGLSLTGARREFCRTWPAQTEVTVPGLHFLPEDAPDEIGQAIAVWLAPPAGGAVRPRPPE